MHLANPERYCGLFLIHCSLKKFKRMTREAMDVCLRVLKESSKSRFDNYSVRNSVLIISHITFRDCRVHIFSDNLSRNSCIPTSSLNFFTTDRYRDVIYRAKESIRTWFLQSIPLSITCILVIAIIRYSYVKLVFI